MLSPVLRARHVLAWAAAVGAGALVVSCASATLGAESAATSAGPATTATAPATPPGASPAGTASPAPTPGGPGPCGTSALRVTLGAWKGAGAGHFYRSLDFTNISGARCTLDGYPGVSFVTAVGGTQAGAAAGRTPASRRLVVLAPGGKAHALLDLLDILNFGPSACAASSAHWLKVYPPHQSSASYIRWTAQVCSHPKPVYMYVSPVRTGA